VSWRPGFVDQGLELQRFGAASGAEDAHDEREVGAALRKLTHGGDEHLGALELLDPPGEDNMEGLRGNCSSERDLSRARGWKVSRSTPEPRHRSLCPRTIERLKFGGSVLVFAISRAAPETIACSPATRTGGSAVPTFFIRRFFTFAMVCIECTSGRFMLRATVSPTVPETQ
jgi:hypothetical protein